MAVFVGDIFTFALDQRLFGQQVINTGAVKVVQVPNGTTEQAFAVAMWGTDGQAFLKADGWASTLADMQTTEVTYKQWVITRAEPNATNTIVLPTVGILAGTRAPTCETANISMAITRKGLDKGKRNKGRVAIAGIPTANYAAGEFDANAMVRGAAFAQWLWRPVIDVVGYILNVGFYVPYHTGTVNGAEVEYPAKFTPCVDAYAQRTVRVQRSRTVGVGR